ncbi:MAG: hypothetical protein M3083_18450 [Actinomycetota bacterium]|nr:hypothetical protein [Actinomycetota bacterium]
MGRATRAGGAWARCRAYLTDPRQPPLVYFGSLLAAIWSRVEPPIKVTDRRSSLAPSDNLQTPMNLVMPLRYPQVAYKAQLGQMLFEAVDEILAGLNNVGTVHFARFDVIEGNLCMFSIFDGDFNGYIRDFIGAIGGAFDGIMGFVKDPAPTPCGENVDEFVDWVRRHDSLQMPEFPTDVSPDLVALQRRTLVLLHRNQNAQMGVYRGYPGYSVAQIRQGLGIGW